MVETKSETNSIYSAAKHWAEAGVCLIPIYADGSKKPDWAAMPEYFDEIEQKKKHGWKPYQSRMSTPEEHKHWFGNGTSHGLGLVHGKVSGNSEMLDFDEVGLFERYEALCREQGYGDLLDTMPLIETPSGGRHLGYRCQQPVSGNQKLAQRLVDAREGDPNARTVDGRWVTVETRIETRGEGGYTLGPGSPPECHPDHKPYRFLRGRPATLPVISAEDRDALLALASTFNEYVEPTYIVDSPRKDRSASGNEGLRPGDDYSLRGDYESLLEQHGWRRMRGGGDKGLWQRPGKDGRGISATSNYGGSSLFYVFSSNAMPFIPQKAYSPFAVYALLEHGGDFREAAKTLGQEGYGDQIKIGVEIRTPGWSRNQDNSGSNRQAPSGQTFRSAAPHVPGSSWEKPVSFAAHALPAFPTEALPPVLAAYVGEIAASSQVPADMAALLGLAVLGAAGARRCIVQIGRTHSEPLNLFCAVVMEPGSRKSAIMDMTAPLREYEAVLVRKEAPLVSAAKEARAVEEKRMGFLRDQAAKEKDSQKRADTLSELQDMAASFTEVPAMPRLLADDVTPEKCASLMAENAGALALLSAEGGVFGILAGRYSGKGDANLDVFLKGHAGDEIRVDRQNRPPDYIRRPALTVGLLVQPDVIASLADSPAFRGRGLLGRFLYSLPESLAGTRKYQDRPVDAVIKAQYGYAIEQILDLPSAGTEEDATLRHSLPLTGDALALWAAFADEVEARQAESGDLSGLRDWASKLAGQVARIAAGFHLMENAGGDWQGSISPEAVAAAWTVGQYLIPHAQAAFGQMSADPRLALGRRIVRWITRTLTPDAETGEATFTLRECQRTHTGTGHTASGEDVQAALLLLLEREYIRPAQARQETGGRPGSAAYVVNPAVFDPETARN